MLKNKQRSRKMDNLNKEILRLSIPTIVSNVTVPLLGLCDTAISGHLGSELYLSAIAVGSVMLNVVFWIFGFLRGGTTGLTANALGSNSSNEISKILYKALMIAFGAGILIIVLQIPIFKGLWWIVGGDREIEIFVNDYFKFRVWGSPALLATMAISGWFVGMQNTFFPMLIAILMNIINIIGSCVLVFFCDLGFNGIAIGTMLSNWLGLCVAVCCLLVFSKRNMINWKPDNLFRGEWLRYFFVNGNLFLRSLCIICVTMGVTAAGARLGNLTLAVNAVVMQFFLFFSFFMDGFAFSGEAMVGLRKGEQNYDSLDKCVGRLLQWTLGTGLVFSLFYLAGIDSITGLLTESGNVAQGVSDLYFWIVAIPIVSCWAFIFDGFYIGITDTYKMMISALLGGIIFFAIISLNFIENSVGFPFQGNQIIWTAFIGYLATRGLYLAAMWKPSLKKLAKGVAENVQPHP